MGFLSDWKIKRAFKNVKKLLDLYDLLGMDSGEDKRFIEQLEKAYIARDYEMVFRMIGEKENEYAQNKVGQEAQ